MRPVERDLRLDFFRGIGLWMIFLDHIPHDVVSWLTLRNYGFSDAAEFFVFISGYLVGWIYVPIVRGGLFLAAVKRLWKRVAQMYVAHIMLFLIFTAQIARTARRLDNPLYENEMNVFNFLQHPDVLIGQALTLRYKPVNLDVLPLYITLVFAAPFIVWCLVRRPNLTLLGSIVLFILSRWFDWNIASYPPGTTWYFNPFCWQLLFVFAAWCGRRRDRKVLEMGLVENCLDHSRGLDLVRVFHCHDLAQRIPRIADSEMDDQGDLSRSTRPISTCCASRTSWRSPPSLRFLSHASGSH